MAGECGVVGQRMRREEIGLDGWRNKRQATVRGLHSQESTRLPEVDKIDGRAELRFEAAPRIEEGDWVQGSVAQHTDIDVAVATRLIPSVAPVQPDSQHAPVRKGLGEFPKQRVGKTGESDHVKHHIWADRIGCSREPLTAAGLTACSRCPRTSVRGFFVKAIYPMMLRRRET